MRALATLALACLALAGAGCGDEEPSSADRSEPEPAPRVVARGPGPAVELPAGAPPKGLIVEELREGDGAAARPGDELEVEYVGVRYDGAPFTNSWERSKPFRFELGGGSVLVNPGWEKGLVGMRIGARRKLIVPPDLQYPGGAPPESSPDDTLVYVIDLIAIR